MLNLEQELKGNRYPGRGILLGRSKDGKSAVIAYFIMGRSETAATVSLRKQKTASGQKHLTSLR